MNKKLAVLMTGAILTSSLMAGCGKSSDDANGNEKPKSDAKYSGVLDVAAFEGGYGKDFWLEAEKRFEKLYPEVDVKINASPNIGDVIRPQIAAGNPPDFIYHSSQDAKSVAKALIKDKNLADLSDVFSKPAPGETTSIKDKMLDGFLSNSTVAPYEDGNVYLAPLYYNLTGLWYNKALFAEKGWEVPKTWDQFFELGDKAKKEGISLFTYQGQAPAYLEAFIWPAIASAAGEDAVKNIFSYGEDAWSNDGVKTAFSNVEKIGKDDYLLKGSVAMSHIQAQTDHLKGKALFCPNGNWYEGEMADAIQPGWEWGFMAPPVVKEGDTQYATTMVEEMYIPKSSDNIETSKEFMRFLYSDEMIELNSKLSGAVVPVKNGVEIAKQYVAESNYNSFKIFDEGVKPIVVAWDTVEKSEINMNNELFNKVGAVLNGDLSVDDWIKQMNKANDKVRAAK